VCWHVGDRCEQVGDVVWCVADEEFIKFWKVRAKLLNILRYLIALVTVTVRVSVRIIAPAARRRGVAEVCCINQMPYS